MSNDISKKNSRLDTLGSHLSFALTTLAPQEKHADYAKTEFLNAAIEQMEERVAITDTRGTILYVNPAFEKITGYSRDEVLGKRTSILKSGKQSQAFYTELWETISKGHVWYGRLVNRKKNGDLFTEEGTVSPIVNASGDISFYVSVKSDVSKFELLERQLHQAQKMESIGKLAGGVAHDFNNMLSVIIGYSEMALKHLESSHKLYPGIQEVLSAGKRSADLTNQLLAFSRTQTINPRPIDLNDSVNSIQKMLRRLIGEDITLLWLPGTDLGTVLVDPTQVDQILVNLCVNARDAISGNGKLILETENIIVHEAILKIESYMKPGDYTLLTISDNGCGMDKETLLRIFEPFFTTKAEGEGTGLGLATVYGIVKQNDCYICAYSELGQGTTFKIYFPHFKGQHLPDRPKEETEVTASNGEVILLVEDEASILELTRVILKAIGYRIFAFPSAEEALDFVQGQCDKIDLLIVDVVLPNINGSELAKTIAGFFPDIKVLFMSGYPPDTLIRRGVLEEGVNFINKPFSKNDLAMKIETIIDT